MPLLLTLARHWFDSGANMFQVISQCQPAHAALMRGVHAPLRHYLSLKNRVFFLIYTLWNTSRAFKCSQSRAAATAVATNPLRGSGNVYLLYEAATSIRKLLSSPAVFLRSIQCFLIYTRAVARGLSPHRGIRACWLRDINLPKDLCSLLEIFGIKHVTSLLWSWQL